MVVICGFIEMESMSTLYFIIILVFRTNKLYKKYLPILSATLTLHIIIYLT